MIHLLGELSDSFEEQDWVADRPTDVGRLCFYRRLNCVTKVAIRKVSIRTMHLESAGSIPARDMKKKPQTGIR